MALTIDGDRVRELRQANGWTLRAFAEVAQISHGYLSKIENDLATASPEVMWQLADALGVPLAALTGDHKAFAAAMRSALRSPKAVRGQRPAKAMA